MRTVFSSQDPQVPAITTLGRKGFRWERALLETSTCGRLMGSVGTFSGALQTSVVTRRQADPQTAASVLGARGALLEVAVPWSVDAAGRGSRCGFRLAGSRTATNRYQFAESVAFHSRVLRTWGVIAGRRVLDYVWPFGDGEFAWRDPYLRHLPITIVEKISLQHQYLFIERAQKMIAKGAHCVAELKAPMRAAEAQFSSVDEVELDNRASMAFNIGKDVCGALIGLSDPTTGSEYEAAD